MFNDEWSLANAHYAQRRQQHSRQRQDDIYRACLVHLACKDSDYFRNGKEKARKVMHGCTIAVAKAGG
jgi:hypothetical protein